MLAFLLTSVLFLISPSSALKCDFHLDSNKNYFCVLSNSAPNEQRFVHTINGYGDANVTSISSIVDANSFLSILDDTLMKKFVNLRKIVISLFKIKEVAQNAFEVCENIEEISLNWNDLSDLPAGVFKKCKNLKILKLASNSFTKIPVDGFEGLEGLEVLKFDNNPLLEVMADDYKYLTGVKQIFMSETGINKFNVSNFEVIDLRNNNFYRFEVRNAPNLRSLNLSRNSLTSVKFSGPSNLTELDISMNSLSDLPLDTFKELNNLKVLKLSWNPQIFKNLSPSAFRGLTSLEILELKTCKIDEISGLTFYLLENLLELDLSHNSIWDLPYMFLFRELVNLKILKINSNSLEKIKSTTFKELKSLTILDLSHNMINKIDQNSFSFLENLEKLNLGSNRIEMLEINMFPYYSTKLVELDVSYNLIKAIEPEFDAKFNKNLQFIGAENSCVDKSLAKNLEKCYKNYEDLKNTKDTTTREVTTTAEATTKEINEKLEFSLKDLLITLICILFIAILLIFFVLYINGLLNIFGINEKPIVVDNNDSQVPYQKF